MGTHMTRFQTGFLFAASALTLAACASPTGSEVSGGTVKVGQSDGRDGVVVTAQRRESSVQDVAVPVQAITQEQAYAPPAPPPPPVGMPAPMGKMDTYAQVMPQPMPGDVNRDKYQDVQINGVKLVAQEPVSTFSIDVDTASYSNVRRMLNAGHLPPKDAVRIEELINYFDYDYALPKSKNTPFETTVKVVPSPWAEGRQLMHVAVQGYDINRDARPPLNLTLLIDVSGSMSAQNKLPLAIQSLKLLINEMTAKDTIAIAVYAGAAGTVLEPTSGADKAKIMAALDKLSAGGSTAGGEGLRLAYNLAKQNFSKNSVNRVMLLSDGDFNVGINDPNALEDFVSRERESGVYLSILGFGGGNYNDLLMQKLAQSGNGMAAYIDTLNEGRKVLNDDLSGSMFSIADDVKIQVEFNPAQVSEYRLIGYQNRLLNREDFANDKVDAGDIGAGHEVTALYEITPAGSAATRLPALRYGAEKTLKTSSATGELAHLRLRYKLPDAQASKLVETPILTNSLTAKPSQSLRFASAVAAYADLLRGGKNIGEWNWNNVSETAQASLGEDRYGLRREFVGLVQQGQKIVANEGNAPRIAGE